MLITHWGGTPALVREFVATRGPSSLVRSRWALLALVGLASCAGPGWFQCDEASQCSLAGQAGTCEPSGYCSFPDESCESGQRYGAHAPADIAGSCVSEPEPATTSTTAGGTGAVEGSHTGSTTTGNPLDDGTTTAAMTTFEVSEGTTAASSSDSTSTDGSETGSPAAVLHYQAALAECNDPVYLDPDACELGGSPSMGAMVVDLIDVDAGPIHGFLRFDFDDALVPDLVVSVTLRMVATNVSTSSSSGEVHRVEPFELIDLFSFQPAPVGPLLAPDQGPVASGAVVEWALPPELLSLHESSLYLGILPLSSDGIDYWNLDGAVPPQLVVEQRP
jgi:hypothetical protein